MHRSAASRAALVTCLALGAAGLAVTPASADTTCAKWAATTGSDAAAGTATAPYRSLGKLVASLQAGQTGCLPAGRTYYAVAGNGVVGGGVGTSAAAVTVTSGPGGRASVMGQLWLRPESHDVVLRGLDFRGGYTPTGPMYAKQTHLILHGDRLAVLDNDISDPRGICIGAGKGHATDPTVNDVAEDLRVQGNRIHDCGMDPAIAWSSADSGAHGVYLENTLRARISDNLIYRNRWRGLQLWPRNDGAVVERNLFDENATHVNIGSSLGPEYGGGFVARNTTVRGNIFTGRVTTFAPTQNPSQLYGFFPAGSPSYGNLVTGNCFAPHDAAATGYGFATGPSTTAQALFVDRAARDYRLTPASPCQGLGPAAISSSSTDRYVSVTAPGTAATGDAVSAVARVVNRAAQQASVTVDVAVTAGAKLLSLTPSSGSCTGTVCTGVVPANGSLTLTVGVGVTAAGTVGVSASLREADVTPADDRASATVSSSGPACTVAGTDAAETVQGTAGGDVLCLFGGNDTALPAGGADVVIGGAGTDRLSYWNAGNAATVNMTQGAAWDSGAGTAIGYDTFRGVEWATGTAHADTLVGSPAADTIDGLEGDDAVWGYGGDDRLKGWAGSDTLHGGDGNDTLEGGDGTDRCDQGAGTGTKVGCEA